MSFHSWQVPADAYKNKILPLRARAEVRNTWLTQRLDEVLAELMQREGFDMWIVAAREYNEDPVIMTLLPEPAMSARRRTILVFGLDADGRLERLTLDRYGHGDFYRAAWNPDEEDQYDCLARIVRERDPQSIGLDVSENFAFADGLTHNEYTNIAAALGEPYTARIKGAERLAVGWLERRIPPELTVYRGIVEIGHAIIAEAFSNLVVQPGITTTDDVVWWMRQKMLDLGLQAWFQPTVDIQARGEPFAPIGKKEQERRKLIQPGDMLHCDVGFVYLGLATDQQQLAYVLEPGESEAPAGLRAGLAEGNRFQDIHLEAMAVGRTGNQVLRVALEKAKGEGLNPMLYTHPIGYHGHAAGPTIGLWDQQGGVPGRGDYELFDDTCYSIELNVKKAIPEWDGQEVMFGLEEEAALSGGRMYWLDGRQTAFHLIG
ncbi:MAG: M24 family metallopeptidase [Chloroflexota bacterium]